MPAVTPQQNTVAFASGVYSAVKVSAPIPVPADHNNFLITIQRAALPAIASVVVSVRIDLSVDGGVTWSPDPAGEAVWPWGPFPLHFSLGGGVILAGATAVTDSSIGVSIKAGPNQQLRVTITPALVINTKIQTATANGAINAAAIS